MTLKFAKPDRYAERERVDYSKLALAKKVAKPDAKFRADTRDKGCQVKKRSPHRAEHHCSPRRGTEYSGFVPVIDFAHVPTGGTGKGMGRKASDRGNGIGLCHDLHMELERIGPDSFEAKYEINLREIADELAADYERRFPNR